jgi:hypothetical protein
MKGAFWEAKSSSKRLSIASARRREQLAEAKKRSAAAYKINLNVHNYTSSQVESGGCKNLSRDVD